MLHGWFNVIPDVRPDRTGRCVVDCPPAARRVSVAGNDVIGWVQRQPDRPPVAAPAAQWERAGWGSALDLYEWARRSEFLDRADDDGSTRRELVSRWLRDDPPPPPFVPTGHDIDLPAAVPVTLPGLRDAALSRRTVRHFDPDGCSRAVLGATLRNGLAQVRGTRRAASAAWSSGDPLGAFVSFGACTETYVIGLRLTDLDAGVYHYSVERHALARLSSQRLGKQLMSWIHGQVPPMTAAWTIVLVADYGCYRWRYRHERALLNLYLDAGRIGQWLIMAGRQHGLQTFQTPAFKDSELARSLQLPPPERAGPLYTLSMGLPRSRAADAVVGVED